LKAVILAGGLGTRISEESYLKPKPMIEIGGKPILWHIMKIYSQHGVNDFIVCCGYKGYVIKEYFANYFVHQSDITFDLSNNEMEVHDRRAEPWKITLVDTGEKTMTGGRLKSVSKYLENEKFFCMTYGDGLSNLDITKSIEFHKRHKKKATITAVSPAARFGALNIIDSQVNNFIEKPRGDGGLVNGGFFVLSTQVLNLISSESCVWEKEPLERLAIEGELMAFEHDDFWQPMDTLRDKVLLEDLWQSGKAPWKIW
jgi:glucose-1-phosphate cytidylyltransferase